jgi:hypothetical protein
LALPAVHKAWRLIRTVIDFNQIHIIGYYSSVIRQSRLPQIAHHPPSVAKRRFITEEGFGLLTLPEDFTPM